MTENGRSTDVVDFWFDPLCGWSWIASRWLVEVAGLRPLTIRWHPFALAVHDAEPGTPVRAERLHELSKRFVRVSAAVAVRHGNAATGAFYTALGTRVHGPGGLFAPVRAAASPDELTDARVAALQQAGPVIGAALTEAGLTAELTTAMDDVSLDGRLLAIRRGVPGGRLPARPLGVPMISVNGGAALFGPVVGDILDGDAAARFWDAFRVFAVQESFFELKRAVERPPMREYLRG